jgi:hypothetical protein
MSKTKVILYSFIFMSRYSLNLTHEPDTNLIRNLQVKIIGSYLVNLYSFIHIFQHDDI